MKRVLPITLILLMGMLLNCKSATSVGKKGKMGVLKCENEKPVLYRMNKETGEVTEKGSVFLPEGETCKKAASKEEKEILKMQRDGEWVKYYSGTKLILEKGLYVKGKKEGVFTFYTKEGQESKTVTYKNNEKEGEEMSLFAGTHDWREKGNNAKNEKTGLWQSRLKADADCIDEGNYVKGEKSGPWVECSQDDQTKKIYVSFRGSYQSGLRNGPSVAFNAEGNKSSEGSYRADMACKNNPNEADKTTCQKKGGKWSFYHGNGNVAEEGNYDAATGRRSGTWREYYKSGQKMGEGPRDHTRLGMWTFYEKNGSVMGRYRFDKSDFTFSNGEIYENGRKIAESLPAKNCKDFVNRMGKTVKKCDHDEGDLAGTLLKYDADNDTLSIKIAMKRGFWALYNEQGQKIGEGSFLNGRKDGTWGELEGGRWVTNNYMMGKKK